MHVSGIPVQTGYSKCVYISRHAVCVETDGYWTLQGGGLRVDIVDCTVFVMFNFINKVYQVNFKHLTEFILTVSNQPYYKPILSLIINQSQSKFDYKLADLIMATTNWE